MPWLRWGDGETKRIVLLEAGAHQKIIHWVQGKGIDCHGPGCKLCELGAVPSVRWSIEAQGADGQYTWEMANATHQDLVAAGRAMEGLKGLSLRVSRRGTGLDTRYTLIPEGYDQEVARAELAGPAWTDKATANGPEDGPRYSRAQIAADPQGAAAYAKELCAALEENSAGAFQAWIQGEGKAYAEADAVAQLGLFIGYLEKRVEALEEPEEPEPPEIDLEALLA